MAALTLNELYYENKIKNDFYLSAISYDGDSLFLAVNGQIVKRVPLYSHDDLAKLPIITYKINDPYKFLEVLEINNECEQSFDASLEENDDLTKTTQIDRMYLPIRFILIKNQTSEEEDKTIMNFLVTYNKLVNANGYLTTSSQAIFKQMSSVLRWTLNPQNNKPQNNAQLITKDYIQSLNTGNNNQYISLFDQNRGGSEKGTPLVRNNPNAPAITENEFNFDKAGFFGFFALLYVAFNLLVTLVILAIKK